MQARHRSNREGRQRTRIAMLVVGLLTSVVLFGAIASNAAAKTQVGVYMTGEKSEVEASQPRLNAESYPAYLSGGGNHKWEFPPFGNLECPVSFTTKLTSATASVRLVPFVSYFACKAPWGLSVTINYGGCEDTLDVRNEGPPYVGDFGVDCPAGSSYKFGFGGICTVALPDQSGLSKIKLENTGSGSTRAVKATIEVTGLKYTISGAEFACGKNGTYENGTYSGPVTLQGFNEP